MVVGCARCNPPGSRTVVVVVVGRVQVLQRKGRKQSIEDDRDMQSEKVNKYKRGG